MPTKPVTLRLPEELLHAIDAQVAAEDSNRTEVVVAALQEVFSRKRDRGSDAKAAPTPAPKASGDSVLVKRVEELEDKITTVVDRVSSDLLGHLNKRLNTLEEELVSAQTAKTAKTAPTAPPSQAAEKTKSEEAPTETPAPTPRQKRSTSTGESNRKSSTSSSSGRRSQTKGRKKTTSKKRSSKTKSSTTTSEEAKPSIRRSRSKPTKTAQDSATVGGTRSKRGTGEWLTVKEAFEKLGGDPTDPESVVTSEDNSNSVKFNRFRVLSASDYQTFGLEFRPDRRRRRLPCLRQI